MLGHMEVQESYYFLRCFSEYFCSVMRIINLYSDYVPQTIKKKKARKPSNFRTPFSSYGFFYGAAQAITCGVGCVLKINEDHVFRLILNCGLGLIRRNILHVAYQMGIDLLNIFGDFMMTVNWEKRRCTL